MSIVVRSRNGQGCVPLEPDERAGAVSVNGIPKAGRPPDLDLFTRCIEDEYDISPEVKADVVARLHAVVKYLNDPRAVTRAGNALIRATEANTRNREVALRSREILKPPASLPFMEPRRKYDLEGLTDDRDDQETP